MSGRAGGWIAVAVLVTAPPALARDVAISLPAGKLGDSVAALARQRSVSIVLADPRLWNRRVPAVRGHMTVDAAVSLLARAAGGRAARTGDAVWRISLPSRARLRRVVPPPAPTEAAGTGAADVIVVASKRGVSAGRFAGSVDVMAPPPIGIEAGTAALATRSTIISSTYRGAGREKLFVRGVADSSFSGLLQSVTGLYFGDVRLTYSASDPDLQLYDMQSVEVLQGPQGTLYGSGSLAGIIRLNPNPPQRGVAGGSAGAAVSAVAHGGIGADADAMVNLPVTDGLSVRAVGYARSEAGYIDRLGEGAAPARDVNRTRIAGGRVMARWWPGDGWTVDAIGMAQTRRSRDGQYATIGAPRLTVVGRVPEPFGGDYAAAHLVVNGRIGGLDLVSASGVARQDFWERFALDDPLFPRASDVRRQHELATHETRLSRHGSDGSGWVAGMSYLRARGSADVRDVVREFGRRTSIDDTATEVAVFGEGTLRIAPFLSAGAGVRAAQAITRATARVPPASFPVAAGRRRERWLLPTASVLVILTRRLSAYARYQQGARANAAWFLIGIGGNDVPRERIDTLSAGLRWNTDGDWTVEVSVEDAEWHNLQIDTFEGGTGIFIVGLGDWRVTSANALVRGTMLPGLRIDAAATVNRGRAETVPAEGFPTPRLPDVASVVARGGVDWTRSIGRDTVLRASGWVRYDGVSHGVIGPFVALRQGDYVRTGLTIDLDRRADRLTLSADNLLDNRGSRAALGNLLQATTISTPLRPRTIRIGYRRTF